MKVVALAGGVGGARLAHGLQQVLAPGDLTVVVNTADVLLVVTGEPSLLAMPTLRTGVDFHRNGGWG